MSLVSPKVSTKNMYIRTLVAPPLPSGPLSAPSGSLSAQQAGSQTGRLFATGRNFATGHMILLGAATIRTIDFSGLWFSYGQ